MQTPSQSLWQSSLRRCKCSSALSAAFAIVFARRYRHPRRGLSGNSGKSCCMSRFVFVTASQNGSQMSHCQLHRRPSWNTSTCSSLAATFTALNRTTATDRLRSTPTLQHRRRPKIPWALWTQSCKEQYAWSSRMRLPQLSLAGPLHPPQALQPLGTPRQPRPLRRLPQLQAPCLCLC